MDENEPIRVLARNWNNFLRRRLWPCESTPNYRYHRAKLIITIIFGIIEMFRFAFLSFVITKEDASLARLFGGVFRPFGLASRVLCSANALFCLHCVLLRFSLLHGYSNDLLSILAPFEERSFCTTSLRGEYKEKFKVYIKGCSACALFIRFVMSYGHFLSIACSVLLATKEQTIGHIMMWIFWGIVQSCSAYGTWVPDVLQLDVLWFLLKVHFDMEILQLKEDICNNSQANNKAPRIINSFRNIERKLQKFHNFSSDILGIIFLVSGLTNGQLLLIIITIKYDFVAATIMLGCSMIIFSFIFFVFSATSLSRLSIDLNRCLLSFMAQNEHTLSTSEKIDLLDISKTLSSKKNTISFRTLGLKFESNFILRYVFYTFKISGFVINFCHDLMRRNEL